MSESTASTLVRTPQQDRSRRTLERLVEAGLGLLEAEGPDALTVSGITRAARTSVGSFYARFDGKEELLRYLGERALEEALGSWKGFEGIERRGPGDDDLRATVRAAVDSLGDLYLEGSGRAILLLDGTEDPPPTRRRRLEGRLARGLEGALELPELRADLAARVVTSLLQDAVLRTLPLEPEPLLDELVELLVGYLGGEVRASAPADAPDGPETPDALEESDAPDFEPDPFEVWG